MSSLEPRAVFDADNLLRDRIRRCRETLSASQLRVAEYLLATHPQAAFETVHGVAAGAGTSGRSVMRLLRELGYDGFPELQGELRADIERRLSSPRIRFDRGMVAAGVDDVVTGSLELAVENLHSVVRLQPEDIRQAVEAVVTANGAVYLYGAGKTLALATHLWFELTLARPRCQILRGSEFEVVEQLIELGSADTVVVFDFRRYYRTSSIVARVAGERGAKLIVIADAPMSPAAIRADVALDVRTESHSFFDSYIAALALVDVLAELVVREVPPDAMASRLSVYDSLLEEADVLLPEKGLMKRLQE